MRLLRYRLTHPISVDLVKPFTPAPNPAFWARGAVQLNPKPEKVTFSCHLLRRATRGQEFLTVVPGVETEGFLPHVDPRAPAASDEKGFEGSGMDEGLGVDESRHEG